MFGKPVICSNVGAMADRVTDEIDGLHFEMGDPAALARTIKRAASEPGLWPRLAGALPTPPSRDLMVDGFRRIYRGGAENARTPRAAGAGTGADGDTTKERSSARPRRQTPRAKRPLTESILAQ